jgi:hypothetical protein
MQRPRRPIAGQDDVVRIIVHDASPSLSKDAPDGHDDKKKGRIRTGATLA